MSLKPLTAKVDAAAKRVDRAASKLCESNVIVEVTRSEYGSPNAIYVRPYSAVLFRGLTDGKRLTKNKKIPVRVPRPIVSPWRVQVKFYEALQSPEVSVVRALQYISVQDDIEIDPDEAMVTDVTKLLVSAAGLGMSTQILSDSVQVVTSPQDRLLTLPALLVTEKRLDNRRAIEIINICCGVRIQCPKELKLLGGM